MCSKYLLLVIFTCAFVFYACSVAGPVLAVKFYVQRDLSFRLHVFFAASLVQFELWVPCRDAAVIYWLKKPFLTFPSLITP